MRNKIKHFLNKFIDKNFLSLNILVSIFGAMIAGMIVMMLIFTQIKLFIFPLFIIYLSLRLKLYFYIDENDKVNR